MVAPAGAPLLVTTSVEEARALADAGRHVILVVDPQSAADRGGDQGADGDRDQGGGSEPRPRGRIHVFVGRASNPSDAAAVAEMAAEIGARVGVLAEVRSGVRSGGQASR